MRLNDLLSGIKASLKLILVTVDTAGNAAVQLCGFWKVTLRGF